MMPDRDACEYGASRATKTPDSVAGVFSAAFAGGADPEGSKGVDNDEE